MTIALAILLIFVAAAVLMFLRKLPAIIALPSMAMAIALVEVLAGNLTLKDLALGIVADGSIRLADPMVISMFGGMISLLMQKSGVAEHLVKRGAELAGDNPVVVALVMLGIIALLFTTIGGLGAVIMVGTIVLPILASIGVKEHISAGIILFGISLGGLLNANNWAVYRSVLNLDSSMVSGYALAVFAITAVIGTAFVIVELWRSRTVRLRRGFLIRTMVSAAVVALAAFGVALLVESVGSEIALSAARWVFGAGAVVLLGTLIRDLVKERSSKQPPKIHWYAYLIPILPLLLILLYNVPFVMAFICGLAYGVLVTVRKGSLNMISRSIIEGSASVIPALVLMVGIGMLLSAILGPTATGPGQYWHVEGQTTVQPPDSNMLSPLAQTRVWPVMTDMEPLLREIVPKSVLGYVLLFTLLGPLALYRGPLNVWGLGYGVGGVLMATGVPAPAVMGVLMSLGIIQGVSDPTNTQNVWLANEVRLDVNVILWRTLPYSWIVAALGLIVAGLKFFL